MNPIPWVEATLLQPRGYGEEYPLPEELDGETVQTLAEGRSRLSLAGQGSYGLRRAVDDVLARELGPYGALRYGDTFYQVGRDAKRRIVDRLQWWGFIVDQVKATPREEAVRLLDGLYNADLVKVRGVGRLAADSKLPEEAIRSTFITYEREGRGWKINTPRRADWPDWAERLADGEAVMTKATFPEVPPETLVAAAREIEDAEERTK